MTEPNRNITEPLTATGQRFIPELESLRGLAALSVVVEHCFPYTSGPEPGYFAKNPSFQVKFHWLLHVVFDGRAAVMLFFALSGFVLSIQLSALASRSPRPLIGYAIRRFFRLWPLMAVTMMLGYCAAQLTGLPENINVSMLFRNIVFINCDINPPAWTLYYELVCSLLFPILYVLATNTSKIVRIIIIVPLGVLFEVPGLPGCTQFLAFFYLGLLARTEGAALIAWLGGPWARFVFAIALLLYGIAPQLWAFRASPRAFDDAVFYGNLEMPAAAMIVCYTAYARRGVTGRLLRNKVVRHLGQISFSLYLVHYLIVLPLWPFIVAKTDGLLGGYFLLQELLMLAIVMPCSILIAALTYRLIEIPTNRLGRSIARLITGDQHPSLLKSAAAV